MPKFCLSFLLLVTLLCAPLVHQAQAQTDHLPPRVEAALTPLYSAASVSFVNPNTYFEWGFIYNTDGNPGSIETSHDNEMHERVLVYSNTAGIVHTHPHRADPRPSAADVNIAKSAHIPNWVLSESELWVAEPNGKVVKVADVEWHDNKLIITYRN